MTGSTDLAVREPAPSGALAIYADQVEWSPMQEAALNQLGLKNAPNGDRMVFLHQSQRTGLDPFAKQIHMIERAGKWGIQTGIDGFRVMRARAERKAGVRGLLGQAVYIDAEGNEYKRWFKPMPPVGCEITYIVRELTAVGTIETPYTSYLRFTEYAQYKNDGKLTQKWSQSPAHMLEKCTEADTYRKAFPQDFSGVDLSDAPSAPDEDAPPAQPQRQRVTAEQARVRAPQTVTAEVVTPGVPPADEQPPPPAAEPVAPAGDPAGGTRKPQPASTGQVGMIRKRFTELYPGEESEQDRWERLAQTARLAGIDATVTSLGSTSELTGEQAVRVRKALDKVSSAAELEALIASGEVPSGE
jgi:hypothetical protein